jgi:hypothetical protein
VGWSWTRPTRGWNQTGLKKKQGKKKLGWPGVLTRQDPVKTRLQPVDFCFFTKTTSFWFKKKNWPGQPRTRALNRAGSKNYACNNKKILKRKKIRRERIWLDPSQSNLTWDSIEPQPNRVPSSFFQLHRVCLSYMRDLYRIVFFYSQ